MSGIRIYGWTVAVLTSLAVIGCATREPFVDSDLASMLATSHEAGTVAAASVNAAEDAGAVQQVGHVETEFGSPDPFSIRDATSPDWKPPAAWDMTVDEAIQIALANSTVLRDLGARIVQAPGLTPTIYGPALQSTDATSGIDAALSAFDAQVSSDLFVEDNDRVLNNEFVGGGVNFFEQQLTRFESSLTKQSATGALFALRHNFEGDLNNSLRNLIDGRAWSWDFEGEVRQPLLQGRGVQFNRIAGPNSTPGVYNGILIARLNADISVTQLEIALRDYLSDVENAYWDLHFAYVDLEVKTNARDRSLSTYQLLKTRAEEGIPGAERDKLAQAKEQYFRFEEEVQNALAGRLMIGTRAFNGSGGGTFQGTGGVYANERRLRLIMGLPINDGRLIRTSTQPTAAPVTYDWNDVVANALSRRTELRRQQLNVERRRLELTASRNFAQPRLDALGAYRFRGLGDRIYDPKVPVLGQSADSATQEWWLGLSLTYPVGFRQAHAAARNAQLQLSRERELMRELERQVVYGVSNAIAETDRAYEVLRYAINRVEAARDQYEVLFPEAQAPVRQFDFNALLDSERRLADAETNRHRAAVQYALATKNLNFEMGTLLEYFNIHLAEGGWPRRSEPTEGHLKRALRRISTALPRWHRESQPLPRKRVQIQPTQGEPTLAEPPLESMLGPGETLVPDGTEVPQEWLSPNDPAESLPIETTAAPESVPQSLGAPDGAGVLDGAEVLDAAGGGDATDTGR